MLELLVVLISLVETVSSVSHDHVEELFEDGSVEVELKVISILVVAPERSENFIGIVAVLKLFIELIGAASDGNAAVEANEADG